MFNNSPDNQPKGAVIFNEIDVNTPQRRNQSLKRGFLVLSFGFLLAFISLALRTITQNGI
jgi:hypothetical protein